MNVASIASLKPIGYAYAVTAYTCTSMQHFYIFAILQTHGTLQITIIINISIVQCHVRIARTFAAGCTYRSSPLSRKIVEFFRLECASSTL